jgi:hypothetical protein
MPFNSPLAVRAVDEIGSVMLRKLSALVTLSCGFFAAALASAYNEAGHMVSGSVAYSVLSKEDPAALAKIVAILKQHPLFDNWKRKLDELPTDEQDRFLLMLAARWPDDIRGNKKYTHPEWHYVDFPWRSAGQPESLAVENPKPENALTAFEQNLEVLKGDAPDAEKAIALCWILHLTADLHQPLHTISRYTTETPSGDAGGTKVFAIPPGHNQPLSLHFFWDDLILNNDCFCMAKDRANGLVARPEFSRDKLTKSTDLNPRHWAENESFELAKKVVYDNGNLSFAPSPESAVPLSTEYGAAAKQVAERQIVLSGYRIAELMNRIFGRTAAD